jgi:hypothetical protein
LRKCLVCFGLVASKKAHEPCISQHRHGSLLTNPSHYESSSLEPYPDPHNGIIAGICYGQLASAAVSSSRSLHELVPLAIDAVLLAFRGGILTARKGIDLEGEKASGSWAVSVSRETGLDTDDGLAKFHHSKVTLFSSHTELRMFIAC